MPERAVEEQEQMQGGHGSSGMSTSCKGCADDDAAHTLEPHLMQRPFLLIGQRRLFQRDTEHFRGTSFLI
jgi:hypothetical protein